MATQYPITVRRGFASVKIYEIARKTGGNYYSVVWNVGRKRHILQRGTLEKARAEAAAQAEHLAAGRASVGVQMTTDHVQLLAQAKRVCGNVPILAALDEWKKARTLCGGSLLPAAELWSRRNSRQIKRVKVSDAIEGFIKAKEKAGKQGERIYRSKLKALGESLGNQFIDGVTSSQLTAYLENFQDGVTRNDYRKRAVALWRWAQRSGFIPHGVQLAIEQTERAVEEASEIGTITPQTFGRLLEFFKKEHPKHLAALVVAGFGAVRADEIHGKRADREKRQTWEDIDLSRKHLNVTVAKRNTPAWRLVDLSDAAIEWLALCPEPHTGPICEAGAMEKIRLLARNAENKAGEKLFPDLPDNCFRHSAISYKIAVTGDKPATATWAGNSVAEIDRR
jgi:integrase